MPWHTVRGGGTCGPNEWAVIKDSDGSTAECHPSEEAANRQMAALYANYANESDAERAELKAATINDLPDSAFAYIEPGGKKDDQGKTVPRSLRHFPIHDAAHVRNALARAPQSPFGARAMPKIRAAARKFGIGQPAEANRAEQLPFSRSWDVEDVIIRSDGKGRTVEAYTAVFNSAAEIRDQHGHYLEEIDPAAFNRTLSHGIDRVGVFYHHGMTLHGTPSDLGSVPIGRAMEIRPDKRGLLTVTQYNRSDLADAILESIRNRDPMGYSFRGRIIRSNPKRPPRARNGGQPSLWRHLELGLTEYGPTPNPAYADASIVAVRAHLSEAQKLISTLTSPTPHRDPDDDTTTPDVGPGAEDSRDRALRSAQLLRLKSEMRARGV